MIDPNKLEEVRRLVDKWRHDSEKVIVSPSTGRWMAQKCADELEAIFSEWIPLTDQLTEQIPWEALRPEIEWVAMTSYGDWLGSDRKPKIVTELNMERWMPLLMTLAAVAMPDVNREQWRETLCKRPEDK